MTHFVAAGTGALKHPVLAVSIDAEEDFDWDAPFSRHAHGLESLRHQDLAQRIFERHRLKPTYLIDYPVVSDADARRYFRNLVTRGLADVGAQLHPWVNPPFEEPLSQRNSFLNNLPVELQARKITVLTEALAEHLGVRPTVFRAGRYGLDHHTLELLPGHGYTLDTSVMPHTDFSSGGGPSFHRFPDRPFWVDHVGGLLEIPVTRGFAGRLRRYGRHVFPLLEKPAAARLRVPGVLSRLGIIERITLSPEGIDFEAMRRLTVAQIEAGHRVFCLSYHSSSLGIGNTPYVRSEADREVLLKRLSSYLDFFSRELGGRFASLAELAQDLRAAALSSGVAAGAADEPPHPAGERRRLAT